MFKANDGVKRAFDLAVAFPMFVITLPVQAITALIVLRRLGRPVFFRQVRPGLHGQPFEMIKFRTMLEVDVSMGRGDDASRMTGLGKVLRSTSIDELPTLWNVLRGDMSLVGPRPLLVRYLERYTSEQARRHDVRPGLTGPVQAFGRNGLSWEAKFLLDVAYVDHHTFVGDLLILLHTVRSVLSKKGVAADGQATMSEFRGTN